MFGSLTPSLPSFSGSGSSLLGSRSNAADTPPKKAPSKYGSRPPSTSINHLSRAAISLEYASLRYRSHCPLGVYVTPFPDDPSTWDAILFVHQG
ncbi:hypothetical protein BC826DRAFT_208128 [Russula brevipes]|nr:hypothetical protein BC826DRAFT_208128 [Russula brevipes]